MESRKKFWKWHREWIRECLERIGIRGKWLSRWLRICRLVDRKSASWQHYDWKPSAIHWRCE